MAPRTPAADDRSPGADQGTTVDQAAVEAAAAADQPGVDAAAPELELAGADAPTETVTLQVDQPNGEIRLSIAGDEPAIYTVVDGTVDVAAVDVEEFLRAVPGSSRPATS